jgi:hypothetical protein
MNPRPVAPPHCLDDTVCISVAYRGASTRGVTTYVSVTELQRTSPTLPPPRGLVPPRGTRPCIPVRLPCVARTARLAQACPRYVDAPGADGLKPTAAVTRRGTIQHAPHILPLPSCPPRPSLAQLRSGGLWICGTLRPKTLIRLVEVALHGLSLSIRASRYNTHYSRLFYDLTNSRLVLGGRRTQVGPGGPWILLSGMRVSRSMIKSCLQ